MATKKPIKKRKTPKPQDRGAAYLIGRLKRDHPPVYAKYLAGLYPSVNKAAEAAGLRPRTGGIAALMKAWEKSSPSDRDAFIASTVPVPMTIPPMRLVSIVDADHCLHKEVRDYLAAWIFYNEPKVGRIMLDLGYSSSDTRLSTAIKSGRRIDADIVAVLGPWLTKHGLIRHAAP